MDFCPKLAEAVFLSECSVPWQNFYSITYLCAAVMRSYKLGFRQLSLCPGADLQPSQDLNLSASHHQSGRRNIQLPVVHAANASCKYRWKTPFISQASIGIFKKRTQTVLRPRRRAQRKALWFSLEQGTITEGHHDPSSQRTERAAPVSGWRAAACSGEAAAAPGRQLMLTPAPLV